LRSDELGAYFCKIDLNDLLQGDIKTRMEYVRTMIQNGVISPNEARGMEHLDEITEGDGHWIQQNMMPMDKAEEILMQKKNPKPNDENA
jgi:phage portal protein BeeE